MAERASAESTILVVERDECLRELLGLHLSGAGYRVLSAADALAAVRLVLRKPPDLILADVNVRYVDGLEFMAAVREDGLTRNVPVVFLTDGDRRAEQALARGGQAYLAKPILARRLLAVVAEQLDRSLPPPSAGRPAARM